MVPAWFLLDTSLVPRLLRTSLGTRLVRYRPNTASGGTTATTMFGRAPVLLGPAIDTSLLTLPVVPEIRYADFPES